MSKPVVGIYIFEQEITTFQYNDIVRFVSEFAGMSGENSVKIVCDKFPLRIRGKLSELSPNARKYFDDWHSRGQIRNISVVKELKCERETLTQN